MWAGWLADGAWLAVIFLSLCADLMEENVEDIDVWLLACLSLSYILRKLCTAPCTIRIATRY